MKFRLKAFGLHLSGSLCALSLALGTLYLAWYRWPGWYLTDAAHVVGIMVLVDAALGPLVTLIIANPAKSARELTRDIGMVVAVQLCALAYGSFTLWQGRPLYYVYSDERVQLIQASDIDTSERALARRVNPEFAPTWSSLPRWVWARDPDDPAEQSRIRRSMVAGNDVTDMPRYYRPFGECGQELRQHLKRVDKLIFFSPGERRRLKDRLRARGIDPDQPDAIALTGRARPILVVLDPKSLRVEALLRAN